jgi:predicted DNA binding protein
MTSKDFKQIIIDRLNEVLKPEGFKKSGNMFSSSNGDLAYFINIQSSQDSTASILKVTVNIEIYSSIVYKLQDSSLPEKWSRHYTQRIGSLFDNTNDKWWTIVNDKEANEAANEIAEITSNKVLPTLYKLKTTNDLATLWRQNICPGLTEQQRKEYLNLLDKEK